MKLTLKEISGIVNGVLIGKEDLVVTNVNTLENSCESDLSFFGNKKYGHFLKDSKAGAIFFPEDIPYDEYKNKNLILVKNPRFAFLQIASVIDKERFEKIKPGISPKASVCDTVKLGRDISIGHNAVIEDNTVIGDNTKIMANVFIGGDCKIGRNCILYPNVTVREKTVIGDNCIIHPGVVIGGDGFGFETVGKDVFKVPQVGYVEIADNVEIGANTTIDRAAAGKTYIGKNTKIDNLVMIAHGVQVGENTTIVSQVGIAGSTKIGSHVTLAGQVGIVGHVEIGDNVVIGAQGGVMSSVAPGSIVAGHPLQPYRQYLHSCAVIKKLPEIYEKLKPLLKEKKAGDK